MPDTPRGLGFVGDTSSEDDGSLPADYVGENETWSCFMSSGPRKVEAPGLSFVGISISSRMRHG